MSESKPHIHFPIRGLYRNGGVFATVDVADYLQATGRYCVSILNYSGVHQARPKTDLDVRVPSVRGLRLIPKRWRAALAQWQRTRAMARSLRSADLIVAADDVGPTLTEVTRVATRLGKPLCFVVHIDLDHKFSSPDFSQRWSKAQTLAYYRHADRIICVSHGIRDSLVEDMPEKADALVAIQNGVDLARLDRLAAEAPPADRPLPTLPYFVGVGRLVHAKGFDLLIEAHARVLARGGPRHAIVLVGEGRQHDALQRQAAMLGVEDTVLFYGYAANPFPVMARATALCTSSRFEGFPLTTTEGAALGIPVIATRCPHGPPEILEDGRYGALLPPDDSEGLAEAMLAHLTDPAPLRQKAAASFRTRERLSAERCHRQYAAVFDALLPTPPRRRIRAARALTSLKALGGSRNLSLLLPM